MKLQLALDVLHTDQAIELALATHEEVDIYEIGTPLIKHEGVRVVETFRSRFADKELLVDLKTMDAGAYEAGFCIEAGADLVTVLAVADNRTVCGVLEAAQRFGGRVVADLINVSDLELRAKQLADLGVDILLAHTGIDQQHDGRTPFGDLQRLFRTIQIPLAVAGGIGLGCIDEVVALNPAIVVVGAAITSAKDPRAEAATLCARLNR